MGTRLIALDLDGTLLNEKMHVSEKTRQVMELCAQRGIEIVPATGRALPAVPEEVLRLPGVHYGIFTNGAVVRDFGINRDNSDRKLEHIRQGVDTLILTDQHVPSSAGLEPAVAITAQQDRRPRGMIENIILYDRLPRRAEQGTTGTVIPDHVIRE